MHDFTILIAQGSFASGVAVTLDILSTAAAMAASLKTTPPTWQLRTFGREPVVLSNGLSVKAKPLTRGNAHDRSVWIVPGLATNTPAAVDARLAQSDAVRAATLLKSHVKNGGAAAASCSAVFLLQVAGLLHERKVTTTWWLAPHLSAREPHSRVDANRMVIADGPIWTAGAAFAQVDLMLQLLRAQCGAALAEAVAKVLLIDGRDAQAPYIVPAMMTNGNTLVAELSSRIESALPKAPSIGELAKDLCMSERTLARRVQAATGRNPSALVQSIRLKRARALLETSRMSVDRIAERVGYRDATALRRLMRKLYGVTPRQFRRSAS